MPRRLRTPKRRRGAGIDVSESLFHYLVWRDWDGAIARALPGASKWELFDAIGSQHSHKDAWHAIVDEALEAWVARYPGSRPESWWRWSAPELRRVSGRFVRRPGRERCQPSGVPYGSPADWNDRPMVESEAAYLDRLDPWIAGERARVPAEAFDPQPFSWKLIRTADDGSDDDDDDDDDDDQGESDDDTGAL